MTKAQIECALELATAEQLASALGRKRGYRCGHNPEQPETCKLCSERQRIRKLRGCQKPTKK